MRGCVLKTNPFFVCKDVLLCRIFDFTQQVTAMGNVNVKIRLGNYCETLTENFNSLIVLEVNDQ